MPNDLLLRAREARRQTRRELVVEVNRFLYGDAAAAGHSAFNRNYLGKLERGEITYPSAEYRSALRSVLGVATDEELGFFDRRCAKPNAVDALATPVERIYAVDMVSDAAEVTGTVENVNRRALVIGSGLVTGAAALGVPTMELLQPSRGEDEGPVNPDEIAEVVATANLLEHWDNTHGGATTRGLADDALRRSARLLRRSCPSDLHTALHTALARLSGVVAFMLFDAYAHDDARRRFAFALECAELGVDWHQRAYLLCSMARQAIWCGLPDDGLTYIEMGLVRSDRLTATEQAMLHTVQARALAKLGPARAQDALTAVGAADEQFAHSRPSQDPSWMRFYDAAQHHGDTGHALYDISVGTALRTEAADRLRYSVDHHEPEFVRSRAISETTLASLTMVRGDPSEAAAIGQAALDDAGPVQSNRAADGLRALRRLGTPHAALPDVAALLARIDTTVGAAA